MGMPPLPPVPPVGETLATMRAALNRLNDSQFAAQSRSLEGRLAEIESRASQLTAVDGADFGIALSAMSNVLPELASGVLLAIEGFRDGDSLSGVQGLMDTCASLAPVIGAAVGAGIAGLTTLGIGAPVGAEVGFLIGMLVGSIFSMIGDILGFFAPKSESLAKTIQTLLQNQKADAVQSDVRTVHHSFLIYASTLNDQCDRLGSRSGLASHEFQPGVMTEVIRDLNFVEGNSMTRYWQVIDWLADPNNQTHRLWPLILNGACNAYTVLLLAVVRLHSIVTTNVMMERYKQADEDGRKELKALWNAATAKLETYSVCNRLNLEELRGLSQAVQNRGTLWRMTPVLEAGVIDPRLEPTRFYGGPALGMSVTVCSQDQTKPDAPYHLYAIAGGYQLYYWRLICEASDNRIGFRKEHDGWTLGPLVNDVFAIPGTDLAKPNHCRVYEISTGNKIEGKYRDADAKEMGTFCSIALPPNLAHTMGTFTSVRAVHDPYGYADDPANGFLKDVQSIVYATGDPTTGRPPQPEALHNIAVSLNGTGLHFVPSPVGVTTGIAVDQDYLWVYSSAEIACATHAAMARTTKGGGAPAWIRHTAIPGGRLHRLGSCDDGTLVAAVKDGSEVYSASYRADRKKGILTAYDGNGPVKWTRIRDCRAEYLEKLPVFCWPQFESLTETLEALQQAFARGSYAGGR